MQSQEVEGMVEVMTEEKPAEAISDKLQGIIPFQGNRLKFSVTF